MLSTGRPSETEEREIPPSFQMAEPACPSIRNGRGAAKVPGIPRRVLFDLFLETLSKIVVLTDSITVLKKQILFLE